MSSGETLALIASLRALGVTKAKFSPEGQIVSVEMGLAQLSDGSSSSPSNELLERPPSKAMARLLKGDL